MRIVGELKATTLFVTHNIQEAIYLADRVMVMTPRPGKIAEIIEVKFERPRDISIQTSREFNIIIEQVRDTLGSH
jgi:NitT/TauT family transport system ATP-binding protein